MDHQRTPFDLLLQHHVGAALATRKSWRSVYDALEQHGVTYAIVQERRIFAPRPERGAFFLMDENGHPAQLLAMARDIHPSFEIGGLEAALGHYVDPRDPAADKERAIDQSTSRSEPLERDRMAQRAYDGRGRGLSAVTMERLNEYARGDGWDRFEAHMTPLWDRNPIPDRGADNAHLQRDRQQERELVLNNQERELAL